MKRILSAISLVPLAIALLLTLGMTTAGPATAMTTSSASSIVKDAPSYHPENFKCHWEDYGHGHYYYHCYAKYKDHGQWYDYDWWLKDGYNPPGSHPDYPDYFWCHYQKHHGDKEYYCYYNYYDNHHWKKYYWWWDYDPPNPPNHH